MRRLEGTLKYIKFCIFGSAHNDHASPTMLHEMKLNPIVLNLSLFLLSMFHAIQIRFEPLTTKKKKVDRPPTLIQGEHLS